MRHLRPGLLLVSSILLVSAAHADKKRTESSHFPPGHQFRFGGIEPDAGSWRTWVISSGSAHRPAPPPGFVATKTELMQVRDLVRNLDDEDLAKIAFWDAGSPGYRWIDLVNNRLLAGTASTPYPHRIYTYLGQAIYDATIATWDAKYRYRRPRPSELLDHWLNPVVEAPDSPSYPSEHAAAAQAAATVLAYFFPSEAATYQAMAEEAGWSRVQAGVQYPSDYTAGLALGKAIGDEVVAKAKLDGSDAVWSGTVPTGPCKWILPPGTTPVNVTGATWHPILMSSQSQFRPPPPPACDSADVQAQAEYVRTYPRSFISNYKAFYWQSPEGLNVWVYRWADKWMFEDGVHDNPPRAARAYALLGSALFDVFIASQDGKFTYWYIRPHQLNPLIVPLFPVPNHPSFPSNHSSFSATRAEILAYLFPDHAAFARMLGQEAGDSRLWAGIHYQMDNTAGGDLGRSVAELFVDWAETDGSQ